MTQPSTHTLLSLITADAVAASHTIPAETAAHIAAVIRRTANKECGDTLPAEDVGQVATFTAAYMVEVQGFDATLAAVLAVRRCLARLTETQTADTDQHGTDSTDATDDDGEPRARLAMPSSPDPAAQWRTTDADRVALVLAGMDRTEAAALVAAHRAPWKAGKVPAAEIRRALDAHPDLPAYPKVTGRKAVEWTKDAAALVGNATDTARALAPQVAQEVAQGVEPWQPYRYAAPQQAATWTDQAREVAAALVPGHVSRKRTPATKAPAQGWTGTGAPYPGTAARLTTVPAEGPHAAEYRHERPALVRLADTVHVEPVETWTYGEHGATRVRYVTRAHYAQPEGPARLTWTVLAGPRADVVTVPSTPTSRTTSDPRVQDKPRTSGPASHVDHTVPGLPGYWVSAAGDLTGRPTAHRPTPLPAYQGTRSRTERDAERFDAMATDAEHTSAAPIPGVGRDSEGNAYAAAGPGAGRLSGTGTAKPKAKPGKSRSGSTGPTVPAGPGRG